MYSVFLERQLQRFNKVTQPGPYDNGTMSDRIGTLHHFIPLVRGQSQSDCPVAQSMARTLNQFLHIIKPTYDLRFYKRASTENIVDCALCKPDNPHLIKPEVYEIGSLAGVGQATPGLAIQKSGRTSGLTVGKVTAIGVTVEVELDEKETGYFADQVVSDIKSQPGDSGSLIVGNNKKAVGLLFAASDKYTIFNRIENVLDGLNVDLLY